MRSRSWFDASLPVSPVSPATPSPWHSRRDRGRRCGVRAYSGQCFAYGLITFRVFPEAIYRCIVRSVSQPRRDDLMMHFVKAPISQIGRCPYCMRKAFILMIGSWATLLIASAASAPVIALTALSALAIITSALWSAHILGFAVRASLPNSAEKRSHLSRRQMFGKLAKVAGGIALATAIPQLAHASGCSTTCTNGSSSKDCPTGQSCSCYCDGRGDAVCGSCS